MKSGITPTSEQAEAIATAVKMLPGEIMTMHAYAGAGKSSTLTLIADEVSNLDWKTCYVAFNKDMVTEAQGKMPRSVLCKTSHGLAFNPMMRAFPHWKDRVGNFNAKEIGLALKHEKTAEIQVALRIFNRFLASAHRGLEDPLHWFTLERVDQFSDGYVRKEQHKTILSLCQTIYHEMFTRQEAPRFTMPHDAYLWKWVSMKPTLGLDLLLLDEGQDLNPVMIQFALDQKNAGTRVIVVGDRHQSIYGWRGAKNSLHFFGERAQHRLNLTNSFRFPQHIADGASKLLRTHMDDRTQLIGRGTGQPERTPPTRCVIARTNAALIDVAIAHIKGGAKVHFAATRAPAYDPTVPYKLQEIRDVWNLAGRRYAMVKTPLIRRFKSYGELRQFAMAVPPTDEDNQEPTQENRAQPGDPELQAMIQLVDKLGDAVPEYLDSIVGACVAPSEASMFFSTAHRAKGQQWDYVEVLEGFLPLDNEAGLAEVKKNMNHTQFVESLNLLYVAVTRSVVATKYPPDCVEFFSGPKAEAQAAARAPSPKTSTLKPASQPFTAHTPTRPVFVKAVMTPPPLPAETSKPWDTRLRSMLRRFGVG